MSASLPQRALVLIHLLRRQLRLTAAAIARMLYLPSAPVARWRTRNWPGGVAHLDPPEPVRRYLRERSGELLHPGIKKLG